ncbi:MAG TPA: hypothetical protein VHV29_15690, partial [Terriglobales bacterium]|nr:hypothetical protein [Terriglobales bacterium]
VISIRALIRHIVICIGMAATVAISLTGAASATTDGPAELPRVYVTSTMASTPAPGAKTVVPAGANLQLALNNAHCGDTLLLQAGATFTGNYNLPAKACDDQHWIVVRTSAPNSALPAEGKRISPCYAGVASLPGRPSFSCAAPKNVMAKLVASTAGPITLVSGANHYRLGPGLEITRPLNSTMYIAMVAPSGPVNQLVIDRDWIHGVPQYDTVRGVMLSGITYAAVVDSYITDFHCAAQISGCEDAQAIAGGTGSIPQGIWKIHDNFLEAAAENILFGGVSTNSVTPADIEISNNHMFKPLTWMPGQPGFIGRPNSATTKCVTTPGHCPFVVKNLIELKNAQRVLLVGNILEQCWSGFTQHGAAIMVSGMNPADRTLSYISVMDVTARYNRTSHTASVFSLADQGPNYLPIGRISIHDNIFDDVSAKYQNGDTTGAIAGGYSYCTSSTCANGNILVNHNTELITRTSKWFAVVGAVKGPIPNWTYTNNIVSVNPGIAITNGGSTGCTDNKTGNAAKIAACFSPYSMTHNALIGGTGIWPAGNYLPASATTVKFTSYNNANGGNYKLLSTSPYHNVGTDGKDLGADISAVNSYIQGVQ